MSETLRETLDHLREQLHAAGELSVSDRRQLQATVEEIHTSLEDDTIDSASIAQRFHESTQAFCESHPQLTRTAGQFADMLSQMGI